MVAVDEHSILGGFFVFDTTFHETNSASVLVPSIDPVPFYILFVSQGLEGFNSLFIYGAEGEKRSHILGKWIPFGVQHIITSATGPNGHRIKSGRVPSLMVRPKRSRQSLAEAA